MNKYIIYYILIGLVSIDIIFTIYAIKYLGGHELNLLCMNFNIFIMYKIGLSFFGIVGLWFLRNQKYWDFCVSILISIYSLVFIWNLWQTVNYLYY